MANRAVRRQVHNLVKVRGDGGGVITPEAMTTATRRRLLLESFRAFCFAAWPHADKGRSLHWNWHIGVIADHLQALYEGDLGKLKLAINIPPGFAKSLIASVMWPAWLWARDPGLRVLVVSANMTVLQRDSLKSHELIASDWYQQVFAPTWTFSASQDAKSRYDNTVGGSRTIKTTGQTITGVRADIVIIDDPTDASQAFVDKAELPKAIDYYRNVLSSRVNTNPPAKWALIMQRLHPEDLAGHVEKNEPDQWEFVILPNEFDGRRRKSALGYYDFRQKEGDLLFPWLFDEKQTASIKETTDAVEYLTQYQQDPHTKGVGIIQVEQFRFWSPRTLPERWEHLIVSADLTQKVKGSKSRDWAVLQVWGVALKEYYLLDQARERTFSLNLLVSRMVTWAQRRKDLDTLLIEKKALGKDVIRLLKDELVRRNITHVRIVPADPQGTSKQERWNLIEKIVKDGRVYVPDPAKHTWIESVFFRELRSFPFGPHDDQVDTMTQAVIYLDRQSGTGGGKRLGFSLKDAAQNMRAR